MTKAILFDLDGTLLPMDQDAFLKGYLQAFAPRMAKHIEPDLFIQSLLQGTKAMMENREADKINQIVFKEKFLKLTNLDWEKIWPEIDDFYSNVFPELQSLTQPTPWARKVVEGVLEQGYRVAIATNPVFPKVATYHRLAWANIADLPLDLVTVYENSYFTKPHQEYYEGVCQQMGLPAEQCIMVGNDMQEDMWVSQLGMKTYLVEGNIIDRGEPQYPIGGRGTLEDLYHQVKSRLGVFAV